MRRWSRKHPCSGRFIPPLPKRGAPDRFNFSRFPAFETTLQFHLSEVGEVHVDIIDDPQSMIVDDVASWCMCAADIHRQMTKKER